MLHCPTLQDIVQFNCLVSSRAILILSRIGANPKVNIIRKLLGVWGGFIGVANYVGVSFVEFSILMKCKNK
jgi:hypothetical protein